MRKKILFIAPPTVSRKNIIPKPNAVFSTKMSKEIPLGLLSLATYVQKYSDTEVKIIDFNMILYNDFRNGKFKSLKDIDDIIVNTFKELEHENFDFAGIAAIFSPAHSWLEKICETLKNIFPDIITICGGGVPTSMPRETFEAADKLDLLVYGEGEKAILGIATAENENEYILKAPSIITREKLSKNIVPEFELVENLDEIPPINWSLLDFKKYNSHFKKQNDKEVVFLPFMFSRGCPFHCCFCASKTIRGHKVRYYSKERIKSDVKNAVDNFGVNTIVVWDDNFFVEKEFALELMEYFSKLNLSMEFASSLPVYRIEDDVAKSLWAAGVRTVSLAIESGSPRVLKDIIHKPLKLEMVSKAINILKKYDFYINALFVIGFPGETQKDLKMTFDFIHSHPFNWASIMIATPLPGTELLKICLEKNCLKPGKSALDTDFFSCSIHTEDFTPEEIEYYQQYHTLKKDFLDNLDMKNGRYDRALLNFQYVIGNNHRNPFAYYYASAAAKKSGKTELADEYYGEFEKIIAEKPEWRRFYEEFKEQGYTLEKI